MSDETKKPTEAQLKKQAEERKKQEAQELKAIRVGKVFAYLTACKDKEIDISKVKKWENFTEGVNDPAVRGLYMRAFDSIKTDFEGAYKDEPGLHELAVKIAGTCKI